MSQEAISISKQLRASSMDEAIENFRDELHFLGSLESWLQMEGLVPWDQNQFSYEGKKAVFAYKTGYWMAEIVESLNFPGVFKLELSLDVASVDSSKIQSLMKSVIPLGNPYFCIRVSEGEGQELIVSAVSSVSSEPKNLPLSIGVAINDMLSLKDSLLRALLSVPTSQSLLNY